MSDDLIKSIKFAFEWRKGDFKKLYAYLALVGLVWLFAEVLLKTKLDWMALTQNHYPATFLLAFAFVVLLTFFSAAVELLALRFALKSRKQKTRSFEAMDFVTYFFLDFVVLVCALASAFNPRGLVLLIAVFASGVLAFSVHSAGLLAVAGILLAAYVLVFFYNVLRLSQTQFFFASKERDLFSAMNDSLSATLGNALWLLLFSIGVYFGTGIALLIALGVPTWIVGVLTGGFDSLAARVFSTLLSPVMVFSFLFAGTAIFTLLLKRRKKKAEWGF